MKKMKVKLAMVEVETNLNNKDLKAHIRSRVELTPGKENPILVEVRKIDVNEAQPAVRR